MKLETEGQIPLHWWDIKPNFGDALSPWLAQHISGKPVSFAARHSRSYLSIGSILSHAGNESIVWAPVPLAQRRLPSLQQTLSTGPSVDL